MTSAVPGGLARYGRGDLAAAARRFARSLARWRPQVLAGLSDARVRRWLMLLGAVVVGSMAINALAFVWAGRQQVAGEQELRAAEAQSNEYDMVTIAMSNLRHAQERLAASPNEEAVRDAMAADLAGREALKEAQASAPQLTERLRGLRVLFERDSSLMRAYIARSMALGLDESGGIRGRFRSCIVHVEIELYRWRAPDPLLIELADLRRDEMNYLLHDDRAYADRLHRDAEILRQAVGRTELPPEGKASILAELSEYVTGFDRYAEVSGERKALAGRLEEAGWAVTHQIADLDEEAARSASEAEKAFATGGSVLRRASLVMMLLLGGISMTLAVIVVRDVARTIEAVETSERVKSEFLAMMSHELRTPLNAVLGLSELMQNQTGGPLNRFYLDCAEGVRSGGWRLLECVDDLLEVARLNAGGDVVLPRPVLLEDVLASAVEGAEAQARRHGIDFEVEYTPGLEAMGDGRMAGQVVAKLLSNAVKFTPAGGRVRLSTRQDDGQVRIEVSDTGPGIAPAMIAEVIKPFVQSESGLNRSHEGRGLGLTIASRLAAQQQGSLELKSRLGEGVVAVFTLPAVEAPVLHS